MNLRSRHRVARIVAPLTVASLALASAGPAMALDTGGRSAGYGAPATIRKACLSRIDSRAAHLARLAERAAGREWASAEHGDDLVSDIAADLATIEEMRAAAQRAPFDTELLDACRDAFAGTRMIVAVDARKVAVVIGADRLDHFLGDTQGRLDAAAAAIESARAGGSDVAEASAALDSLNAALDQIDADAAALVDAVLGLVPSDWEDGAAQAVFADARAAMAELRGMLGDLREWGATLAELLGGDAL